VFVEHGAGTQSAEHIKPLHWHVACRLVIEGGFPPEEIAPHPPLRAASHKGVLLLEYDPDQADFGERTLYGGLKTKSVDVVVTKKGIGPVLAISIKGTLNAFRNLTNRMEEAAGDCANLHIAYPALVYGFLHVLKANREGRGVKPDDVAVRRDGKIVDAICRYHDVLTRLTRREGLRNEVSKYEAVALALACADTPSVGEWIPGYPQRGSPLLFSDFFDRMYREYDLRFVYSAPALAHATRRLGWGPDSPVFRQPGIAGFQPRLAAD
jgi:hypothetical protein